MIAIVAVQAVADAAAHSARGGVGASESEKIIRLTDKKYEMEDKDNKIAESKNIYFLITVGGLSKLFSESQNSLTTGNSLVAFSFMGLLRSSPPYYRIGARHSLLNLVFVCRISAAAVCVSQCARTIFACVCIL